MSTRDKTEPHQINKETLVKAQAVYRELLTGPQSATLATINADGSPLVSYSPFAVDEEITFYIFISRLAKHTANLERNPQVSLMLITDEAATKQIFARPRLTFACKATMLARDTAAWEVAAAIYDARFSSFFKLIRGFSDFNMFQLTPTDGVLVAGFGQAFTLSGNKLDRWTLRRN